MTADQNSYRYRNGKAKFRRNRTNGLATFELPSNDMGNIFHGHHWDYRIQGVREKWHWYPDGRLEYEP